MNIATSCKGLPDEQLRTKTGWVAHDLDKTLNAEAGTDGFASILQRETAILQSHLDEWASRAIAQDETFQWAHAILSEARSVLRGQNLESGSPESSSSSDAEHLYRAITERRSIRRWKEEPVPDEIIRKIISAGQWAPSACNRQSCRYLVIRDQEGKDLLAGVREKWLSRAPILVLVGVDRRNYLPEELDFLPYMDASMASQNVLLISQALGLGAVFVKCTEADLGFVRKREDAHRVQDFYETLSIPSSFLPVGIVALGYPARIPKAPPRAALERVLEWDRFETPVSVKPEADLHSVSFRQRAGLFIIEFLRRVFYKLGIKVSVYGIMDQ